VAVVHAMAADCHAGVDQRVQVLRREEPRDVEAVGDHEERGGQAPLAQRREGELEVGDVAVVKRDADVVAPRHGVEHGREASLAHPDVVLAVV